eukprot:TRINITY_DN112116_c0_g1_i1.p1 TRINITY_DN112116_c0_g1~~TRINITY_DN112116_c0_g1_i1.p1  ORF type:complete len:152 (+),score=38.96 TRINITY_DN112116_c0_g1_i1:26-481(+)
MSAAMDGGKVEAAGYASGAAAPAAPQRLPKVHSCSASCLGKLVHFHVTLLEGSAFIWVGSPRLGLDDLQVAVPTKYDPLPSVACLRGESDGSGSNLAQKLSRRFGMLIYFSFNLPDAEPEMLLAVQKEITSLLSSLLEQTAAPQTADAVKN